MTTEEIQQEIERTRGEMAGTLHAIERKLSPRQLMDQAVDTMRELVGEQSQVGSMIRENPLPLAVIGLGVGWLALSGAFGRRSEAHEFTPGTGDSTVSPSWTGGSEGAVGESGYGAESTGGFSPLTDARERAGQIADQAREGLQRAGEAGRRQVSQWTSTARDAAGDAADRTMEAYQDHPLTMGAVALVLGAAVGAMLPRTAAEGRVVGGTGRNILHQARETGGELMERAGRVAKRALHAAKEKGAEAVGAAEEAATMH